MRLDDVRFRQTWLDFLRHPASQEVRNELGLSFGMRCLTWIVLMIAAPFLIITIRGAREGFRALWSVISFEPFRDNSDSIEHNPDAFQPVIAHGIIIGPDRKHGLALSTMKPSSEYSLDRVALIATQLGKLYSQGSNDPRDAEIYALLRDDNYRPYRRRKIPASHDAGMELLLLDVEIDLAQCRQSLLGTMLFAMALKKGDGGATMQLPWAVAESAVTL
ncbi:hypothetical protein [Anatilimnocola floriformis]|uniref:hypothetical protein n=1 Tax=Anatilimnocola floriformis TaxID=2948575 RepID=UPI0020C1CC3E|nr:hypothetical protein [Anatilimnocola floriformis]